jgi:hypothetical protein
MAKGCCSFNEEREEEIFNEYFIQRTGGDF